MKNFRILFVLVAASFTYINLQAQCAGDNWDFDEDDFAPGSTSQVEAGVAAPMTTNQIDLNNDGTLDVEVTYEAVVTTPNANGTCDDGSFSIGAGWGGTGALNTASDFAGTSGDDCVCTNGYIVMTTDLINGFNSDVANFEFNATSQNGASEAYEYGFGFVTGATDAAGVPIAGLNSAAAVTAAIAGYCNAQYAAGMTVSSIALTSPTGVFTIQADDLNATVNDCATSNQNGEDTGSGTGPNSGLTTGVSGLAPTDLITQVTYIYGLSNAPGSDCDGDGDTGVGSSPSGSFAGIEGCFAPPCGYTFDAMVVEDCGEFVIELTNIVGEGAANPVGTEAYEVLVNGVVMGYLDGVTGVAQTINLVAMAPLIADGSTMYTVNIRLDTDSTCISDDVVLIAPLGVMPTCGVFPANGN